MGVGGLGGGGSCYGTHKCLSIQGDIKAPPPDRAGVREVCSPSNIFIMKASHRSLSVSITSPRSPEAGQSYLRRLSSDGRRRAHLKGPADTKVGTVTLFWPRI